MECRIPIAEGAWLRLLRRDDAEELHALVEGERERLAVWMPWAADQDLAGTVAYLDEGRQQLEANQGFQTALIRDGRIAGSVGFHALDWTNRSTSIGYWLSAEVEGRGLMTAAVRALVDHALDGWRLHRVTIEAAVGNARSRAIPERLGFREEGIMRAPSWSAAATSTACSTRCWPRSGRGRRRRRSAARSRSRSARRGRS
jgi:ribosomal-protein-serine acetyltransferase